ncbi:MAG: hypothetical protein K8L99_22050 [Anaerolineae bacterium]|nr:hypothetical protein [Anaerolineae bacterium]
MLIKVRYLMVGILLIILSLAAFQAPLMAQDEPEPEATEDPCLANLELAWESLDWESLDEDEPDVFEDPVFMACLDALETVGQDPAEDPELASVIENLATPEAAAPTTTDNSSPDTQGSSTRLNVAPAAGTNFVYVTNSGFFMVRYWVSWFDGVTGALGAAGSGEFAINSSRVVWVPSNAKNVSLRIEVMNFINQWDSPSGCSWVLGDESFVTAGGTFHPGWPSLWVVTGALPDVRCGPGDPPL